MRYLLPVLFLLASCGATEECTMSFLELSGVPFAVRDGSMTRSVERLGVTMQSWNGAALKDQRAVNRSWSMDTVPLTRTEARMLAGMLEGRGDVLPSGSDEAIGSLADTALYSSKGAYPTGTPIASSIPVFAADGARIYKPDALSWAPSEGSVSVDPATTNLSAVRSTNGDASVWTALGGASVADVVTDYLIATGCVEGTIDAGQTFYRSAMATGLAAVTTYTASFYIKRTSGTGTLEVLLTDITNGISTASQSVTLSDGEWVRHVNLTITTGALGTVALRLQFGNASAPMVVCVDGLQVEAKAYSTAFYNAATARAANSLTYAADELSSAEAGLTFLIHTNGPNLAQTTLSSALLHIGSAVLNYNQLRVSRATAANNIAISLWGDDGDTATLTYSATPWDGGWHVVGVVLRANPMSGEYGLELYLDGVMVAQSSITAAQMPDFSAFETINIGHRDSGSSPWIGSIGPSFMLPYPMTQDAMAIFAPSGVSYPELLMEGDCLEDSGLNVLGQYDGSRLVQGSVGGAWNNNLEVVSLTLNEVD